MNCSLKGKRPSYVALFKNHGEKRIDFIFDKAHLAVTLDSVYVFPFHSAESKSKMIYYDGLDEPFRIIYNPKEKRDKYSVIKTISESVSIKTKNGTTIIGFKISEVDSGRELIFDREITVANKAKRNADFRAKSKGLCIFMMRLNLMPRSFGVALKQKKKKQNNRL